MNAKKQEILNIADYKVLLNGIQKRIQESQLKAMLAVNSELILLYWEIGKMLSEKMQDEGWGAKTIDKLAKDLSSGAPKASGFSARNLRYMRRFFETYKDVPILQRAVAKLPWGHNVILIEKLKSNDQRLWYADQAIENGWSRPMLILWIESDLYSRQGKAITNFKDTMPSIDSDLAEQTLKDPYNFSFLTLDKKHREQDLEQGLIDHIQKFLLELGQGFAFVGRQVKLDFGGKDYQIDLLFYHLKLRSFVIIELKATEFDPRDVGQINFYLSAVDDLLRHPSDNPSIGLILCKTKDNFTAEYAIRDIKKPIGIAEYEIQIVESLPKNLKGSLPTVEEIEAELGDECDVK
jgi:predicted nuclease of restriction endonuclease-like (RecB) superfamily